jgi:serine/threonine protein phosphatase PrpC
LVYSKQQLLKAGIDAVEAKNTELVNCVGGGAENNYLEIQPIKSAIIQNSHIILCSDGIHGFLNIDEMENLILNLDSEKPFETLKN